MIVGYQYYSVLISGCGHECCSFIVQGGLSPVYVASGYGHTDIVDLLVNAGGDIHLATIMV